MKNTAKEVAIYGGAFNPPTLAHEQVVKEVLKTSHVSHVIISPSGEREDKDFGISSEQRRTLINTYIETMRNAGLSVSLDSFFFEGKNDGLTTTAAEEEYFRKTLGTSPWFIFGNDIAPDMPNWSGNTNKFIEEKLKKIFITRPGHEFDFQGNGFDNYILLDIPHMLDISSSLAKQMLASKQSVKGILHPDIIARLKQENISYN